MRGDQKIIRADRLSRGLQLNADVCVFSIGGNIEREDVQRIEDGLDARKKPGEPLLAAPNRNSAAAMMLTTKP